MKTPRLMLALALVWLTACTPQTQPTPAVGTAERPASTDTPQANMPNPASAYCTGQGYTSEIRSAADGSQSGFCIFADGSECDEWAYFRGECGPLPAPAASTAAAPPTATQAAAEPTATPLPTPDGGTTGWQSYTHADPAFSFLYPSDWSVEPDSNPVSTLYGHALFVHPVTDNESVRLRVVFRPAGEDLLLWPTGAGEGEFVERGAVPFGDGRLARVVLVCDGRDQSVWYRRPVEGEARLGNLEFSFILAVQGACADGLSLSEEMQAIGDMLVTSFQP